MEKKDGEIKFEGDVKSTASKKNGYKIFCITLTDKRIQVKLNELL